MTLEEKALKDLVEKHFVCPKWGSADVELALKTMTLATKLTLKCKARDCAFEEEGAKPAGASLPQCVGDN